MTGQYAISRVGNIAGAAKALEMNEAAYMLLPAGAICACQSVVMSHS